MTADREKLREGLAEDMLRHEWPQAVPGLVSLAEQPASVRDHWLGKADALIAGPLAPILAQADSVERMEAERDAAIKTFEMAATSGGFYARHAETATARAEAAEARADRLSAEVEALRGALRPIADYADQIEAQYGKQVSNDWQSRLLFGLCRAARSTLTRAADQPEPARPADAATEGSAPMSPQDGIRKLIEQAEGGADV